MVLVAESVIAEAVSRLKDGSIVNYRYDAQAAAIVPVALMQTRE